MQKHWTELPWIGFDTETTGLDTSTARILQAAVVTHDPTGELVEEDRVFYIDPGEPIPAAAAAIHGITAEILKEKHAWDSTAGIPYLMGCIQGRSAVRGFPLVIYNAGYDWPLLMAECRRIPDYTFDHYPKPRILDPLVIDRALDKYRKGSRKLVDVASHYGVEIDGTAHDAVADANTSLRVMAALVKAYPQLKTNSLDNLVGQQRAWAADWLRGFEQYQQRKTAGGWPRGFQG